VAETERRRRVRFSAAQIARLATTRPDGGPHLVPITFALDGDRIVSAIDHKPKSTTDLQRLRNIEANPAVSVLADHYEEDWSRLWWVRADGTAVIHEPGGDEVDAAVRLLETKYAAYRAQPPRGPVIVMSVERWASWQA
jgi:PPOX class probable F420-dependent enzyme